MQAARSVDPGQPQVELVGVVLHATLGQTPEGRTVLRVAVAGQTTYQGAPTPFLATVSIYDQLAEDRAHEVRAGVGLRVRGTLELNKWEPEPYTKRELLDTVAQYIEVFSVSDQDLTRAPEGFPILKNGVNRVELTARIAEPITMFFMPIGTLVVGFHAVFGHDQATHHAPVIAVGSPAEPVYDNRPIVGKLISLTGGLEYTKHWMPDGATYYADRIKAETIAFLATDEPQPETELLVAIK